MKKKINQNSVLSFFDETSNYIENNVIISLRKSILRKLVGDVSNQQIIDIGCGNGEITISYIDTNHVTFVDLSKNMLREGEKKIPQAKASHVRFINSSIEMINTTEKYNIIIGFGLLAHVPDISQAVCKLKDLIAHDGKLYIQFTDQSKILSKLLSLKNFVKGTLKRDSQYITNTITLRSIRKQLYECNLIIEKKINYYPVLPLMKFLTFERRIRLLEFLSFNHFLSTFGSEIILVIKNKE